MRTPGNGFSTGRETSKWHEAQGAREGHQGLSACSCLSWHPPASAHSRTRSPARVLRPGWARLPRGIRGGPADPRAHPHRAGYGDGRAAPCHGAGGVAGGPLRVKVGWQPFVSVVGSRPPVHQFEISSTRRQTFCSNGLACLCRSSPPPTPVGSGLGGTLLEVGSTVDPVPPARPPDRSPPVRGLVRITPLPRS